MDIYEALYTTRAMRRRKPDQIALDTQARILDAAIHILGAPRDAGWYLHGVVAMGYPTGKWGVGARKPVHQVAARNSWEGDLRFTVTDPRWPR